jgi:cytochrome c oxidase assembly factor CtaG
MTTIAHDRGVVPAGTDEQTTFGKLILGSLVAWTVLGVAIGVLYANHVIIQEWNQSAALGWQSSSVLYNVLGGAIVWFIGIVVLCGLSWRSGGKT